MPQINNCQHHNKKKKLEDFIELIHIVIVAKPIAQSTLVINIKERGADKDKIL